MCGFYARILLVMRRQLVKNKIGESDDNKHNCGNVAKALMLCNTFVLSQCIKVLVLIF